MQQLEKYFGRAAACAAGIAPARTAAEALMAAVILHTWGVWFWSLDASTALPVTWLARPTFFPTFCLTALSNQQQQV